MTVTSMSKGSLVVTPNFLNVERNLEKTRRKYQY